MTTDTLAGQTEKDPNGKSAHEPGSKLDAGKPRPGLVLGGFARSLAAVVDVGTYGATKYTDNGWMEVPGGIARYTDAMHRHLLKEATGEWADPDTGIAHAAHAAWNALARLDLMLRQRDGQEKRRAADYVTRARNEVASAQHNHYGAGLRGYQIPGMESV